jgi:hypothetical protein
MSGATRLVSEVIAIAATTAGTHIAAELPRRAAVVPSPLLVIILVVLVTVLVAPEAVAVVIVIWRVATRLLAVKHAHLHVHECLGMLLVLGGVHHLRLLLLLQV